ncbi:2-oxoacid:acceptor oxidoreductase subunit alpha [Thermosulfuriphilus sp.]
MKEFSILIGGQAGDGIRQAGNTVAKLLNRLGYRIFFYDDYPSLIRGGHNFSIIRAAEKKILAHRERVDLIVALNQETVERHRWRLKEGGTILFDAQKVKAEGVGVDFRALVRAHQGAPIMRNTAAIGALAGFWEIDWEVVSGVIEDTIPKALETNLQIARSAYEQTVGLGLKVDPLSASPVPLLTGNEAIALGAVQAGLNIYIAYPMTPASSILHYLAAHEEELGVVTVHPESEIAVALMALGAAYAGAKVMVGTSGGGFALMTEAVSLAGQAEIPIVFVECQRAGPSTGVPTYTMQADLFFVLHAGHGEFPRLVVAPGDLEEAFFLTGLALNLAWKFQIPAFVLSDKHLSESTFSFEASPEDLSPVGPLISEERRGYRRYLRTKDGISPLLFPGTPGAVVKVSSYEHDEFGITTEDPEEISRMQAKRLQKARALVKELEGHELLKVYGDPEAETAILCWGATKGACIEIAKDLGLKIIQPLVLEPFPGLLLREALKGTKKVIAVEVNATGQLAQLAKAHGLVVDETVLRYDARPFTIESLKEALEEVL